MGGMPDGFGAELGDMHTAANHVREINNQVQGDLTRLMSELDSQSSAWKGAAAVSFQRLRARWTTDAGKLNDALVHIAGAIEVSKRTYAARDQNSEAKMSAIAKALG